MAIEPEIELRNAQVRFESYPGADETADLRTSLSSVPGVTDILLEACLLKVEYEFPVTNFSIIWNTLVPSLDTSNLAFFEKMRLSLRSFTEQNESDHLLYRENWHSYIEDVYIHYFDYDRKTNRDVRKQLWRRYKKSKKT